MYKLLVVDDEPRQVRALANVIRQVKPEYEVFEAENGQQAFEMISKTHIDIVITDIKMPVMDGLELIERLSEKFSYIKPIIFSGYGEFEYAQKAIRLGAVDYLIKPIAKKQIIEMIDKVTDSIEMKRQEEKEKEKLTEKLNNTLPIYLETQMNKWVNGTLSKDELDEIEKIFPYKGCGTVLITELSKYKDINLNTDSEFPKKLNQFLKYSIKISLSSIGHTISFFTEINKGVMVTILNTKNKFNISSGDSSKNLIEFIKGIKDEYGLIATIGIGSVSDNIFMDVKKCFNEAKSAVEYKFFSGIGKIIDHSSIANNCNNKSLNLHMLENELSDAIQSSSKEKIIKALSHVFENTISKINIESGYFKESLTHILLNLAKKINSLMFEEDYNELLSDIRIKMMRCEEYMELRHNMIEILCRITDVLNNKDDDNNHVIIQKCKKYIDENYMNSISLEGIALKYHFNSSYFSNMFKAYTGTGFSEYLLAVRIDMAKKLLSQTNDKMSDVASSVGFNDAAYFNRMFKREVGISPYKYKQMIINH